MARAIAAALGVGIERRNGYFRCSNGDNITWCYGHMLALCDPEDYDSKYGNWKFEDLPIAHIPWRKKPLSDKKEQIGVIRDLLGGNVPRLFTPEIPMTKDSCWLTNCWSF